MMIAPPPPAAQEPSHEVSGVTVEAPRPPPRRVRTYPAEGATVPFGVLVLTIGFDQPMSADRAPQMVGAAGAEETPDCLPGWRLLPDRRTFVRLCTLKAGHAWRVRLEGDAFRSSQSKPAEPLELSFRSDPQTTDTSLAEALKSAGRAPEEGPIVDWRAPRPVAPASIP